MKNYRELEKQLLSTSESVGMGLTKILKNIGQAVAFITSIVAIIITFTEVAFSSLTPSELLPSATALLVCSYIIYFSLNFLASSGCTFLHLSLTSPLKNFSY